MDNNILVYEKRNVYGNELLYLTEATALQKMTAKALQRLTGKKTIDQDDIEALKVMGFKVYSKDEYFARCTS